MSCISGVRQPGHLRQVQVVCGLRGAMANNVNGAVNGAWCDGAVALGGGHFSHPATATSCISGIQQGSCGQWCIACMSCSNSPGNQGGEGGGRRVCVQLYSLTCEAHIFVAAATSLLCSTPALILTPPPWLVQHIPTHDGRVPAVLKACEGVDAAGWGRVPVTLLLQLQAGTQLCALACKWDSRAVHNTQTYPYALQAAHQDAVPVFWQLERTIGSC